MSEEVWTDERCYIKELINSEAHPGASLAQCRVTAGTLTQNHALSVDEWYVLVSGEGMMHLGNQPAFKVAAGDRVYIPAGTAQQIRNTQDTDLVFHCLCMPRFEPGSYHSLETAQ
ncbi:MAG: cupin domain-containing protein [Pseudomonadota bacterium]